MNEEPAPDVRPSSGRKAWYALIPVVALAALAVLLIRRDAVEERIPEQPPIEITAIKIEPREVPLATRFIGKTRSVSRVEIRARVDGFLEKRLYTEGVMVEAGQLLFQMDKKPFEAKLESSRAALQAQEAALAYAKLNLDRTQAMVGNNVTARKDLDSAISTHKSDLANVEVAKAQVQQDQLQLSYTTISSPIRGLTSFAQQEVGAYISSTGSNSLLTYVAQLDPIRVEFSVSENLALRAHDYEKKGLLKDSEGKSSVEIELIDGTIYPHRGKITFADASLSETTGTFLVRATLPNPDGELRPGQFVRIALRGAVRPNAIVLPQRAVLQNAQGSFVWVVDAEMKVRAQPVDPGDWYGKTQWFIDGGLRAGETVVVDGAGKLSGGARVKITGYETVTIDDNDGDGKPSGQPQEEGKKKP